MVHVVADGSLGPSGPPRRSVPGRAPAPHCLALPLILVLLLCLCRCLCPCCLLIDSGLAGLLLHFVEFLPGGIKRFLLLVRHRILYCASSLSHWAASRRRAAGIGIKGGRAQTIFALLEVELVVQGIDFLFLLVELVLPLVGGVLAIGGVAAAASTVAALAAGADWHRWRAAGRPRSGFRWWGDCRYRSGGWPDWARVCSCGRFARNPRVTERRRRRSTSRRPPTGAEPPWPRVSCASCDHPFAGPRFCSRPAIAKSYPVPVPSTQYPVPQGAATGDRVLTTNN